MSLWQIKNMFGKFLDTVSEHRLINICWKLCTRILSFLVLLFQVTLSKAKIYEMFSLGEMSSTELRNLHGCLKFR